MKKHFVLLAIALLTSVLSMAESTFVDSGITYKITSDSTVNIIQSSEFGSRYQVLKDSVLVVPSTVEYKDTTYRVICIEKYAFSLWQGFNSLVISDGVEEIHDGAFGACPHLRSVTIPKSIKKIQKWNPFRHCVNLESIVVSEDNVTYDSRENCNAVIRKKFNTLIIACNNTVIPSSVEAIGSYAYNGSLIKSIHLPEGLDYIASDAISDCPNLESLHIPSSVTSIAPEVLSKCNNLMSITVDKNNPVLDSRDNCNAIIKGDRLVLGCNTSKIPSGVRRIDEYAFAYCSKLREIIIPEGVEYIGRNAFERCYSLETVKLPSSLLTLDKHENFGRCTSLRSIYIPKNVTSIPSSIFNGCVSLEEIVVDKRNKKYDSRNNCNAIVETKTNKLVAGCRSTTIVDGITEIAEHAFNESGLTSIYIPASVLKIESTSFKENKYCRSIDVADQNPRYKSDGSNSIVERSTNKMILACSTTRILPEVKIIGRFAYLNTLNNMTLPSGIEIIEACAFGNTDLYSIFIPSSVKQIGAAAFSHCIHLIGVVYMGNKPEIGPRAFEYTPYGLLQQTSRNNEKNR